MQILQRKKRRFRSDKINYLDFLFFDYKEQYLQYNTNVDIHVYKLPYKSFDYSFNQNCFVMFKFFLMASTMKNEIQSN